RAFHVTGVQTCALPIFVLLGIAEQLLQAAGQLAILLPQHFKLVARQRGGLAVLTRHLQRERKVGELLQEARVASQPRRHLVASQCFSGLAHAGHSPSNTNAAGPAIVIGASSDGHATCSVPPGSSTATSRAARPRRTSTATAAQAPLPQARVSPAPRSCTRRRIRLGPSTCTKPTLADSGNPAYFCTRGPITATSALATSSTSITACGLPIETAPISRIEPPAA